jgi:hypothetical protein
MRGRRRLLDGKRPSPTRRNSGPSGGDRRRGRWGGVSSCTVVARVKEAETRVSVLGQIADGMGVVKTGAAGTGQGLGPDLFGGHSDTVDLPALKILPCTLRRITLPAPSAGKTTSAVR